MTTPNFRRGAPPEPAPIRDGSWTAKYDGACDDCGGDIVAGQTRVRWNDIETAVIHASHRQGTRA